MDKRQREELIRAFSESDKDPHTIDIEISVNAKWFHGVRSHTTCGVTIVPDEDTDFFTIQSLALEGAKAAIIEMILEVKEQIDPEDEKDYEPNDED